MLVLGPCPFWKETGTANSRFQLALHKVGLCPIAFDSSRCLQKRKSRIQSLVSASLFVWNFHGKRLESTFSHKNGIEHDTPLVDSLQIRIKQPFSIVSLTQNMPPKVRHWNFRKIRKNEIDVMDRQEKAVKMNVPVWIWIKLVTHLEIYECSVPQKSEIGFFRFFPHFRHQNMSIPLEW